jgi:glycosyltransferase involved in cell wall biosynthesis
VRILYSAIDQHVPGTKGGSTHVLAVAEGLAARGHEVHVAAAPGDGGLPAPASDGRLQWHAVEAPLGRAQFRLLRRGALRALAARLRPDVVLERYHNFGGEGLLAAKAVGARTLLEVNAPIIDYPGSPKRLIDRLLLFEPMRRWREWQCRAADLIVTPTASILPDWVPRTRVIETEWGADTDRFRPWPDVPKASLSLDGVTAGAVVVMFVGAFRTWHGVHHLIRAMEQLRARGRGRQAFHAVLIGDGPERPRAEAQVRDAGLDNVTLLGARPHDRIPGYLAAADIGVAPFDVGAHAPLALTFYWSPLKVFEYMSAGLPVVAPDIPRLRAVIRPDTDGLLYDAARPDALADTLERLADPARRAAMGTAARARAVQHFSWAAHCERLDEALQQLVRTRASRGGADSGSGAIRGDSAGSSDAGTRGNSAGRDSSAGHGAARTPSD